MSAIGRVTTQQLWSGSQGQVSAAKARLSQVSAQSSSGIRVTKPSDDPVGTASLLSVMNQQQATTQYASNIGDGLAWAATTDTAMSSSEDLLRKAIDLATQAANSGTMTDVQRDAIATQLTGIKDDLMSQANTKYLGRSVFAGTSDAAAAFDSTGTWTGTAGAAVQRRIGSGTKDVVTVGADGGAAYGTGTGSVFARIQGVVDALKSGSIGDAAVTSGIDSLRSSLTAMSAEHAVVGANYARLTQAKTQNLTQSTALESRRSNLQDADTTQTLLDLKTQELAYQTALQVTAQVIQPTLMSFLQ